MFESVTTTLRRLLPRRFRGDVAIVPVIKLAGVIGTVTNPFRPGLTLGGVARSLERAFSVRNAKAVALLINSPGGSAVQSHFIFQRIRQLAAEKEVKVIAFLEDVAASGGYMIACAADEIVCDPSSIVGSIGVMGGSFGFTELMKKIGVERRLYTAGERKVILDPFLPERPEDVEHLKTLQQQIHGTFIELVKNRRGARLRGSEAELFSGAFWSGERAVEFGLADRMGDIRSYLREQYGEDVTTPLISVERSFFGRRVPSIGQWAESWPALGPAGLAEDAIAAIEARALWARFGL